MKQQNSRMVVEVNKIIANALLSDGGIYLPKIGSLSIVTSSSKEGNPIREIIIQQEEARHKSITTVISERGKCTDQQAEQVYNKWLKVVKAEEKIVILGIGEIEKDGKFTLTPQMFSKLNPVQVKPEQPTEPQPVEKPKAEKAEKKASAEKKSKAKAEKKSTPATPPKRREDKSSNSGYIWGVLAAIAIIVGVIYFTSFDGIKSIPTPLLNIESNSHDEEEVVESEDDSIVTEADVEPQITETEQIAKVVEPVKPAESPVKPAEKPVKAEPQRVTTPTPTKPAANKVSNTKGEDKDDPATILLNEVLEKSKSSTARYRVIVGVFSSAYNGGRALQKIAKVEKLKDLEVKAYPYGSKYILSIFESDRASECEAFRKSELGLSIADDLWIHEKK
ncbi:MAG: hypothetical protein SNJ31_04110 [Rikenellaceae bacterium]